VKSPEGLIDGCVTTHIKSLTRDPNFIAKRFQAFDVKNGYRFRTREYEKNVSTQNSGVMVVAKTKSYASSSDTRPMVGDVVYYGRIIEMVELDYCGDFKVVLFRCECVDVTQGRGIKRDRLGYKLVNFRDLIHTGHRLNDEPFVLPSQVQQAIYVQDRQETEWFIPIPMKLRETYDLGEDAEDENVLFMDTESHIIEIKGASKAEIDAASLVEGT